MSTFEAQKYFCMSVVFYMDYFHFSVKCFINYLVLQMLDEFKGYFISVRVIFL